MAATTQAIRSTIGLKLVMGLTGLIMVGFVFAHMVGNLLVFAGEEALNNYGWLLQEGTHGLIWVVRVVMLTSVIAHVWSAIQISRTNLGARPNRYQGGLKRQKSTYAGITIRWGGAVLLLFVVYHLLHLTIGVAHTDFEHLKPYHNLTTGLSNPVVAGVYEVAMVALALHLYHGTASALQTLGVPRWMEPYRHRIGLAVALPVFLGNSAIVFSVALGLVGAS